MRRTHEGVFCIRQNIGYIVGKLWPEWILHKRFSGARRFSGRNVVEGFKPSGRSESEELYMTVHENRAKLNEVIEKVNLMMEVMNRR
jgi:hypothetical protein